MGINKYNFSHFFDYKIHASIEKESFKKNYKKFAIPIQNHTSNVKFITKPGKYEYEVVAEMEKIIKSNEKY